MHWIEVDGLRMPKLVGGHAALDLCNTWAGWGERRPSPRSEWIGDYDRLAVWSGHAGLVAREQVPGLRRAARRQPAPADNVAERVRSLRRDVYRTVLEPADSASFRRIAAVGRQAAAASELVMGPEGVAEWRLPRSAGLELPLLAAGAAAAQLLSSPELHHVERCPGVHCGWLFLDRRGRRKWCDMATCGNRAKARAFASRARVG